MAIQPKVNYPGKIDTTDANYPEGKAQNVTVPGDGTGTPWEQAVTNDLFGFQQKLLAAASVAPSGNPDSVAASDYFDALNKLFQRFVTYADTGAAAAYVLDSVSGADVDAYPDGHQIIFKAVNGNPGGASTVNVNAIGAQALELPGGAALPADTIVAGQYVHAVYDLANTRYELVNTAESTFFDDSAVTFTAANVQEALVALDAVIGIPSNGSVTMAKLDSTATEADNVAKRVAKAWVNFNGTGVVAIRDSINVSSITDNGVGDYTVNFTVAMPNVNYAAFCSGSRIAASLTHVAPKGAGIYSVNSIQIVCLTGTGVGVADPDIVNTLVLSN